MHPLRELVAVEEALRRIAAATAPLARVERVDLASAAGRVLAAELRADIDSPSFDRSRMDGYAVLAADLASAAPSSPRRLRLAGRALAGAALAPALAPGTCVEVATGARLPAGAEAVVPVENARPVDGVDPAGAGPAVEFRAPAPRGQFVSSRGSDFLEGDLLVPASAVLTPAKVAAAAACGAASLLVRARPRVLVVPTGDEVVAIGKPLGEGSVRESNSHALCAFVASRGGTAERLEVVGDSLAEVRRALSTAGGFDAAVFTGGSSAGSHDFLGQALAAEGEVAFHGVRLRPGKPVLFGRAHGRPVLGLPGNPTSCMIGAHLFLDPLLARLSGAAPALPTVARARLQGDLGPFARASPPDFLTLALVRLEGANAVPILKDSITVSGAALADGFIALPAGAAPPRPGEEADIVLFR